MAADDFFRRWSKPKPAAEEPRAAQSPPVPVPAAPAPTGADLVALGRDSDFRPFLAQGVDEVLKRSALKKLFSDPHFNRMDGLDVYIEDFREFEALPAGVAAALNHAKSLLGQALEESAAPAPAAAPQDETPPAEPQQQPAQPHADGS